MKILSLFFGIILVTMSSCNQNNNQIQNAKTNPEVVSSYIDELNLNDSLPNKRFGKSEIINSKFDSKLIFGSWETNDENPSGCCEINEKRFLLCDYDEGDTERLYRIIVDSIFLDNPYLIFKGKIINSTRDTLAIHWQNNKEPEIFIRKND